MAFRHHRRHSLFNRGATHVNRQRDRDRQRGLRRPARCRARHLIRHRGGRHWRQASWLAQSLRKIRRFQLWTSSAQRNLKHHFATCTLRSTHVTPPRSSRKTSQNGICFPRVEGVATHSVSGELPTRTSSLKVPSL